MEAVIVVAVICAIIGMITGGRKGRQFAGALLGLFLGVLGLIILCFLKPSHDFLVERERERLRIQEEARLPRKLS